MRNAKYCVFWPSIRENHNIFRYQQVRIRFNLLVRVSDSPDRNVSFLTAPNNADEKGEIVISPQFAFGYPFKNGHAKVTLQGHEEVVPGSNGEMHIWQSEQWFCIDRSGRRVDCIETPLKP